MRAVEQPQLGLLPRRDILRELNAERSEIGPGSGEAILDPPLGERLGLDHRAILDAEALAKRCHTLGRGRGHDAIDHRLRESARAEERRGGQEGGSTGGSRWSPKQNKKKQDKTEPA